MAATTQFRKGQFVTYPMRISGYAVEAIVRRVHRNGEVTVEARHVLNPEGEREGCYLGYRYRYDASTLQAA